MAADQFIYQIQPTRPAMLTQGPSDAEAEALQDHFSYLERLAGESVVLLAGRTQTSDDSTFGLVILQADSERQACEIMENDPAVKSGVMRAQLFPYKIAIVAETILENCQ